MDKLITINKELLCKVSWGNMVLGMYDSILIIHDRTYDYVKRTYVDSVRFFDYLKNEYVWKDFNPKLSNRIEKFYVNNERLVLTGNGRCKIFDLQDNLKLLHNIPLNKIHRASFSNDGSKILLTSHNYYARKSYILFIDLKTGKELNRMENYLSIMILDDRIHSFNYNTQASEIYDFSFNRIGIDKISITNMHINHDSRYDYNFMQDKKIGIHDKLRTTEDFSVEYGNFFKYNGITTEHMLIDSMLFVKNNMDINICRVSHTERALKYLGMLKGLRVCYANDKLFIIEEQNNIFSIYSTKGD